MRERGRVLDSPHERLESGSVGQPMPCDDFGSPVLFSGHPRARLTNPLTSRVFRAGIPLQHVRPQYSPQSSAGPVHPRRVDERAKALRRASQFALGGVQFLLCGRPFHRQHESAFDTQRQTPPGQLGQRSDRPRGHHVVRRRRQILGPRPVRRSRSRAGVTRPLPPGRWSVGATARREPPGDRDGRSRARCPAGPHRCRRRRPMTPPGSAARGRHSSAGADPRAAEPPAARSVRAAFLRSPATRRTPKAGTAARGYSFSTSGGVSRETSFIAAVVHAAGRPRGGGALRPRTR